MVTKELAEAVVNAVFDDLDGRAGFDDWWGGIDAEIADEIRRILEEKVLRVLSRATSDEPGR